MAEDEAVQDTNDDATACKRYAVQLGYWKDDFVSLFMKSAERRAPEINRGYYVRVQACYGFVLRFLELTEGKCQIVSLGAGFDTLYWRLHASNNLPRHLYEVDFKPIVARKALSIRNKRKLNDVFTEAKISSCGISSGNYHLIPCDIRNTDNLHHQLLQAGIDTQLPTLFLCECVLVYLAPEESKGLLQYAAKTYPSSVFLNYEPVNLEDRFGHVMIENLKARGCSLLGGLSCKTIDEQKHRYLDSGWASADGMLMSEVYRLFPASDVQRIEKIELLDETELLRQLLDHYCFSWAVNDVSKLGLANVAFTR